MTNEMKYLMYIYSCAAKSAVAEPINYIVDFEKLYRLAEKMSLLSMLAYGLKLSSATGCPEEIKSKLYAAMLGTSLKNKLRMESVLKVLADVEKAGIKAPVLKGLDCARYYSKPECRISADTDLFVAEKDEEKLLAFFEQEGYTVHRKQQGQHHAECVSDETGIIEVHTKIWEDYIYGVMPKKIGKMSGFAERSVLANVNGTQIRVLEPTDAMMFMTLHFVKHFVFGGSSLKMTYDLALYYINSKDLIDAKKYGEWVQRSGYGTVMSAAFSAMVLYCGFEKGSFDAIARFDAQKGERFADSLERYDSCSEEQLPDPALVLKYCTVQSNIKKRGKVYAFLHNAKKMIALKFSTLFPGMAHMERSYPYLKKHPYLYIFACAHRFFSRGTKHVFHSNPKDGRIFNYRENLDSQMTEKEKEQVEMLKDMDLM